MEKTVRGRIEKKTTPGAPPAHLLSSCRSTVLSAPAPKIYQPDVPGLSPPLVMYLVLSGIVQLMTFVMLLAMAVRH